MNIKKIIWLREYFSWMGSHSGYNQLFDVIERVDKGDYKSVYKNPNKRSKIQTRVLSRISRSAQASPFYELSSAALELAALWKIFCQKSQLIHITYIENQLGILPKYIQNGSPFLVGTAHQPASWWRLVHEFPKCLCSLDALIIPASCDVSYFEDFLPGRVHFIPHGVNTDFFRPQEEDLSSPSLHHSPRCVFAGRWLRDIRTLAEVIESVLAQNPGIQFDMLVPRDARQDPDFFRIARHDQVKWHSGISDEQLLMLYQKASLLLMPLIDCTANNALIEAIACGLPIVSSHVGGVPDYAQDTFADLFAIGDTQGMTEAVLRLADSPEERQIRGQAARTFAEENLRWDKIAAQTVEVYDKVLTQ